ncbi:hypothetical protein MMC17_006021 [Xylographa soralifera]|nr:hypothetical protein [Xylographa soralifera]
MTSNLTAQQLDLFHHAEYGQPGRAPEKRVIAADWKTSPFYEPITSVWKVHIEPSQLAKLLNGFLPCEMEDKWFVYTDGPDPDGHIIVHFHRSWTGKKVAELAIETGGGSGEDVPDRSTQMTGITWESSKEKIQGGQDEQTAKRTVREVCRWVLDLELPNEEA